MNLLDKAISIVAPRVALQRVRSRVALELTTGYLERHAQRFRYEGATAGRRAHGWYATSTDANVELMGSLIWLRNRSRDLIRNNPYAARAVEELAGNVVGTGIVPKAKTGNTAIDKIIDAEWPFFADGCDTPQRLDFYGMQTLTVRTMAESGEAILRFRPRPADAGLRIPLQLQMLEADFLDQARTMGLVNGHVMEGVQFDEMGRRVAYWLFSYHPGGVLILNPRGGIVSQPVPADQIMHVYRVLRPGQVRGVPWLTPVMMALRDVDDYCDAERVRKKVEACVTAFVHQPEGVDGDPLGIAGTDPSSGLPVESFQPGMVEYLKPGQDIKFNNPPAAGGYREYKMTELQGIMAGTGLPYELGTGDMSQVNYSSWRGGMLGFRNTVEAYRWLTLIPLFAMRVWRRFIDTLILQGKIPKSAANDPQIGLRSVQWTAPRFESVDPVKDAEGVLKDVRMGRKTWFEAVLENGYDPPTQLAQIALFNKLVDKFEIILDSDPRNTTLRGQEQPAATEERTPSSKAAPTKSKGQGFAGLGGLAVFRNLRNMQQAGVDESLIRTRLDQGIARALPFRFVTAAGYAPNLEAALEAAMLKGVADLKALPGRTGLLVDVSGSMDERIARKSETTRIDAAAGLAILLREKAERVVFATFSNQVAVIPPRRGFALRDAIKASQPHQGTYLRRALQLLRDDAAATGWSDLDRVIVITDEQSHDGILPAFTERAYVVNVAPYKHGVSYRDGWTHIDGWSEHVIDYIRESEADAA